ncbi:pyrimidine/purine nucleoside phosphorylase [Alteromonas pelagimontana]|uniref:Pyrimidine/purine nucleoside phosphorylase n=1 Tax=Alteromonas pelagimontana TaxID=1858656 RepID=A0A6M4M952_9ALTE|nr:pyrimidine/purine nucleoside phosphorylase [Alteromonas pelagimontana]QJR79704.1 pyrimidine/purine nucleoside phosphorylase [Alteromonas pelagimontana]
MAFTVNSYFDDNVRSIAFESVSGPCTSGVMAPGQYTFSTNTHEVMKVMEGELVVRLPQSDEWQSFPAGTQFAVDANLSFDVKVSTPTAYLCFYS